MKPYAPWLLIIATLAMAQQATEKKSDEKKEEQPAPLFNKKLGYKSSKTTKESTTLGFNGIDPSGKVDQKMLATTPGASDAASVKKMSNSRPAPDDLKAFLQEGGLNSK